MKSLLMAEYGIVNLPFPRHRESATPCERIRPDLRLDNFAPRLRGSRLKLWKGHQAFCRAWIKSVDV